MPAVRNPHLLVPRLLRAAVRGVPVGRLRNVPGLRSLHGLLNDLCWVGVRQTVWEIEGSKMYLDPWDPSPMRRTFRSYLLTPKEPVTARMFEALIHPGDTVVDLGANIGFFSLLAARLVGSAGHVYAFEPEPRNFGVLMRNLALNGYDQVVAYQKAAWRKADVLKLYLSNALDTGAHTLRARHSMQYFNQPEGGDAVDVECVVMDAFLGTSRRIDVVKMDIEGAEAGALEGMDGILRKNPAIKLVIEFYPEAMREMGDSPHAFVRKLLCDYEFAAVVVDELGDAKAETHRPRDVNELVRLCDDRRRYVNLFLARA